LTLQAAAEGRPDGAGVRKGEYAASGGFHVTHEWGLQAQPPDGKMRDQNHGGRKEIVEILGAIDPNEAMAPSDAEFGRGPIA
jgi:hypothetical protein